MRGGEGEGFLEGGSSEGVGFDLEERGISGRKSEEGSEVVGGEDRLVGRVENPHRGLLGADHEGTKDDADLLLAEDEKRPVHFFESAPRESDADDDDGGATFQLGIVRRETELELFDATHGGVESWEQLQGKLFVTFEAQVQLEKTLRRAHRPDEAVAAPAIL